VGELIPDLRLDIDRLKLDEEWLDQPRQMYEWSKRVADAQMSLDEARSHLDVTRAELDREVRSNPGDYGLVKVTEGSISAAIEEDPRCMKANSAVRKARHAVDVAKAAVAALEHRKRALTQLVELFVRDYYSGMPQGSTQSSGELRRPVTDAEKEDVRKRGQRDRRQEVVDEDREFD